MWTWAQICTKCKDPESDQDKKAPLPRWQSECECSRSPQTHFYTTGPRVTATVATHPRGSITVSKEALGSNVTSRGNIIQNVAPLVWLSIQTHLEVSERQRQTPLPRLLLGSIISWRRAPRKLTSCYRAAVSKAQTAAVSCSDGAAARRRRACDIKTPGWAAPSSPTRLLFIHHHRLRNRTGMQLRVTESPDLQVLQSSYARKRASVSSGLFFFCAIQIFFFFFKLPNTVHWCVFVWAGLTWWLWKMWGSNSCNSSLCTSTRRHPVITSHQFQQQIHPNPTPIISKNQVSRAV